MESQRNNHQNQNYRRIARPSVGYLLFQYQKELTRRHAEPSRLSRTKIHIIDGLVSRTIRHLRQCSVEDLQACKRELVYKEELRNQLKGMRRRRSSSCAASPLAKETNFKSSLASSSSSVSPSKPASFVIKATPGTPPKPRSQKSSNTTAKVSIFGPEIFV